MSSSPQIGGHLAMVWTPDLQSPVSCPSVSYVEASPRLPFDKLLPDQNLRHPYLVFKKFLLKGNKCEQSWVY